MHLILWNDNNYARQNNMHRFQIDRSFGELRAKRFNALFYNHVQRRGGYDGPDDEADKNQN